MRTYSIFIKQDYIGQLKAENIKDLLEYTAREDLGRLGWTPYAENRTSNKAQGKLVEGDWIVPHVENASVYPVITINSKGELRTTSNLVAVFEGKYPKIKLLEVYLASVANLPEPARLAIGQTLIQYNLIKEMADMVVKKQPPLKAKVD